MDNSDLLRGLSSTTVQVFGIALIVLILALSAEPAAIGKPVALVAALVMLAITANWVAQGIWRAHPDRRHHGHR
jgi:uncharacterized membrane protein